MWFHGATYLEGCVFFCVETPYSNSPFCGIRDITDLICNVSLQDHVFKGSWDLMKESSSLYITTLASPVAVVIVVVEI